MDLDGDNFGFYSEVGAILVRWGILTKWRTGRELVRR
jgi:hypothetical protein